MAKDYAKFVPPKRRNAKPKFWRNGIFLASCLVLIGGLAAGAVYYETTSKQVLANGSQTFITKLSVLVHKKSNNVLAKKTTAVIDQPPPIHFNFYNQLPKVQVTPDEAQPIALGENKLPIPSDPIKIKTAKPKTPEPKEIMVAKTDPVLDPDKVSGLLEAESKPQQAVKTVPTPGEQFIIQLGVFDSQSGALRLADALSSVGFTVNVIKASQGGRQVYRVQQGPFTTMELAKANQQKLKKRGIEGDIFSR
jgi:cell division protein FtsN